MVRSFQSLRAVMRPPHMCRWLVLPIALAIPLARADAAGPRAHPTPARHAHQSGAALFARHCATCHGATARGDGPDAPLFATPPANLTRVVREHDIETLIPVVRDGAARTLALDSAALRAQTVEVEELATYLARLPDVDWRRTERGEEIFVDRCEICHGPFGRPGPSAPPGVGTPRDLAAASFQRTVTDAELLALVRHGRRGMPALTPPLPERDGPVLVAFVRLLSPGFERYSRYCATCHGEDGRGAGSFGEVIPRPTVIFDRHYFTTHDPEHIRVAVWHMARDKTPAMPHFATRLDPSEVRAILTWVRSQPPASDP
jgi:mono/diheme cytochrome c family protein